jgi:hypothetical protein
MPILEGTLLLRFAPEHLIVPVGVERGIDITQVDALIRKPPELVQAVAAIHNVGVDKGR